MEATIRFWDMLRGFGTAAADEAKGRAGARAASGRLEALHAQILDAARRRDRTALRALAERMAAETARAVPGAVALPSELPIYE